MTPTNKLRFVERKSYTSFIEPCTYKMLQQWWEVPTGTSSGEWRGVPLEKEFVDKEKNT